MTDYKGEEKAEKFDKSTVKDNDPKQFKSSAGSASVEEKDSRKLHPEKLKKKVKKKTEEQNELDVNDVNNENRKTDKNEPHIPEQSSEQRPEDGAAQQTRPVVIAIPIEPKIFPPEAIGKNEGNAGVNAGPPLSHSSGPQQEEKDLQGEDSKTLENTSTTVQKEDNTYTATPEILSPYSPKGQLLQPPAPPNLPPEVQLTSEAVKVLNKVKAVVSSNFRLLSLSWNNDMIVLNVEEEDIPLETAFENVRLALRDDGLIPSLSKEQDKYALFILKMPIRKYRNPRLNLFLLIITIITTIFAGSYNFLRYYGEHDISAIFNPRYILEGTFLFAFPLLLILGIHEFGHYYLAKRHNVRVSLPFFIPVPPMFSPLGTAGAFISIREPIPSRKALLDIGIAGPIFGFVIAVPVTIIGVVLTKLIGQPFEPEDGDVIIYGFPIVYRGIENMLAIFVGTGTYAVHPTAFAGWVGFLTTALNLLPIGQLDGGHIAKTIFGPKSKAISLLTIAFVLFFSWSIGDYSYLFFIVLVMFLGLDHPPPLNDITQLEMGRKLLAVGAAIMLIVCYVPAPFKTVSIEHIPAVDADFHNSVQGNVLAGLNISFDVDIKNTGNRDDVIVVDVFSIPKGWVSEMRIDAAIEHTSSNPLPQDAFSPNFTKNSREFTFMVSRGGVFNNTDPLNDPNIGYYPGSNNGSSDNSSGSTAGNGSGVPFSSYFARLPLKKESTVKGRIFFTPPQNASISAFHYIYVKVSSASDKEIYKTTMLNITVGYVEVNMISGILPVYPGSNQNITLKIDNLLFDRALDVEVEAILVPQNSSTFPQPYSLSWTKQEINLPPRLAQYLTIQLSTATTLNHFSNYSIGIEAYGVNLSQNNGNRSFLGRWNYTIPASVQDVLNGSVDKPYIFCASNSTDSQMLNFSLSISNPGPAYFWGNLTVELSSVSFSNGLPFSINWSADSQYILLHPRANTTIAVSILLPASVPSSVYDALFMFYPEGVSTPALTVESRIIVLQK